MGDKPATVDDYLAQFPDEVRSILQKVRESVRTAAPDAEESISYGIPTRIAPPPIRCTSRIRSRSRTS